MPNLNEVEPGWYCFQALSKKEYVAARLIRADLGLETFCPRIAYPKNTKRGKVRFIEPLFPCYLFVNTDLQENFRNIQSIQGIRRLLAYGERVPRIPDYFIEELRKRMTEENLRDIPEPQLETGQRIVITKGPFKDWDAIVSGVMPAKDRVAVLLHFLGRELNVKVPLQDILIPEYSPKERVWEE